MKEKCIKINDKVKLIYQTDAVELVDFEPRISCRFLIYDWIGVESYLIKSIDMNFEKNNNTVKLKIYDVVYPSPLNSIINKCIGGEKENFKLKILNSVGDVVAIYHIEIVNLKTKIKYDWEISDNQIIEVDADLISFHGIKLRNND